MKLKSFLPLLIIVLTFGCTKNPNTFLPHINGYWEIDEVTLSDGTKRDYTHNDTIDYIELNDSLTGFRKKLKPNFSGTYQTSSDAEQVKAVFENDSLFLEYTTPYNTWKETVLDATENRLLILNANKVQYLYKRYQPLDLN